MRAKCIQAVERALGRPLLVTEARGIEDRIGKAVRRMARANPQETMRLTQEQQLRQAGKLAAQELLADAERTQHVIALQAIAAVRLADHVDAQAVRGVDRVDAASRILAPKLDGKDNVQSVETRSTAIKREAYAVLSAEIEKLGPKFLGLFKNDEGGKQLIKELKGEDSGNPEAKVFAEKWKAITEGLRARFNEAGGKIRYLEDWAFPQHHSQVLIAKAGISKWVRTVLPLLDRNRYFDDAGRRMGNEQFGKFVETTWRTLATGGLVDGTAAGVGRSMVANRHAAARELHFKSADAYIEYHDQFGEKSLMATLVDHIDGLSRDLSLVEILGPNPEHAFQVLIDRAKRSDAEADPTRTGNLEKEAMRAARLYNEVAGNHQGAASVGLAKGFDTLRNFLVASRLGSAVITSFSDEATMHLTAQINNIPSFQLSRNELRLLNPANAEDRRILRRAGLGLETLIGSINRGGQEHLFNGMSSRIATFTLRASGLNFLTDVRRQAFGATMMDGLGVLTRSTESLAHLKEGDHRMLLSKGITDADWAVWRKAVPEDWGNGNGLLTPESIYRVSDADIAHLGDPAAVKREAALKLLGVVSEEVDVAVIAPGARERVLMQSHMQRGTWSGELVRSAFLFKSFPIAMMVRHWRRATEMPGWGVAPYLATLIAGTTIAGALTLEVDDILRGKDPRNLNPFQGKAGVKNWFAAMLKGGSLGLYGDFITSETTQGDRGPLASMLGPVAGLAEEALGLTQGNLIQLSQDKDTHAGAELIKFGRGLMPGANHWYAKAALDHLIFHQLQEMASPGYLAHMRSRAQREFGQSFWWGPGEHTPARPPNLEAATGR